MANTVPADVIGTLREAVVGMRQSEIYKEVVEPKEAVLERFQPVFTIENVLKISEDEFCSFLLFDNNHHWTGLHRQNSRMCSDMDKLRNALTLLINNERPVAERLDESIEMVHGMGKNVATAILLITQPELYGVWNNRSEANMKRLGIWPKFERGESFGNRYVKVNQILLQIKEALQIDLWELDTLWWYLDVRADYEEPTVFQNDPVFENKETLTECETHFGLERHLHEFLRDNWDDIELGQDWEIYKEPGDDEAGYEYPCDVGRIDILAKNRVKPTWLVVELKRNQTSDQTVGQLLRYIGWVKRHLADTGDEVYGMIISRQVDDALRYTLVTLPNVEFRLYEVEFHLKKSEIF